MRARSSLLALAAGLALADASIVTLALPELLRELETSVEGVAAVLGVYTVVLAAALVPARRALTGERAAAVCVGGALLFAAASAACAAAGSLPVLLVARGVQALGAAPVLVGAFAALRGERAGPRLWLGAAVLATAAGPALGGVLTEALSWRAIFLVQVPALAAAAAAFAGAGMAPEPAAGAVARRPRGPAVALALLSAALTAVLFLLVLLLVAGWGVSPLRAAAAVSVLPLAALAGARVRGDARVRACAGCALVGGGVLALAFLPDARLLWTVAPQLAAGLGMGLALPALAGGLLPERDTADVAWTLTVRHAGIALVLLALAPVVSADLESATQRARERGVAVVLDAPLGPLDKLTLAPDLLAGVEDDQPRAALRAALQRGRERFSGDDAAAYERLAQRADDTLVTAVGEAFRTAFLVTGVLALLAAGLVLPRRGPAPAAAAAAAALVLAGGYLAAHRALAPEPVRLADPCRERALPDSGGIGGFLQERGLRLLDATACRLGSSREELVLALADPDDARRFEERHGVDPRSAGGLLGGLLRGPGG